MTDTDTDAQVDLDAIRAILQRLPGDDLVCAVAALQVRCTELEAWQAGAGEYGGVGDGAKKKHLFSCP